MPDVREVFDMVIKQAPPQHDALDRQLGRQRRAARNRKLGALTLAAAVAVAVVAFAAIQVRVGRNEPAGNGRSSPSAPIRTQAPIGAQLIGPDGSVLEQLPVDMAGIESPELSPDGGTIAYYDPRGAIASIRTDGTDERVLVPMGGMDTGDAKNAISWSPDGARLAFSWYEEIWVVNADGTDAHPITHSNDAVGNYHPSWSPDGSTIAFWRGTGSGVDGGPEDAEIYSVPADGGQPTRLTHDDSPSIGPAWSPDSRRIVYQSTADEALVVIDADGSDPHAVTPRSVFPWSPAWSPDGTRIAFVSCCAKHRSLGGAPLLRLGTVDLRTGKVSIFDIRIETDNNRPSWSSDGVLFVNRYD